MVQVRSIMLVAAMVAAANWPLFLRMNSLSCKRLAGTWATGQLGNWVEQLGSM